MKRVTRYNDGFVTLFENARLDRRSLELLVQPSLDFDPIGISNHGWVEIEDLLGVFVGYVQPEDQIAEGTAVLAKILQNFDKLCVGDPRS